MTYVPTPHEIERAFEDAREALNQATVKVLWAGLQRALGDDAGAVNALSESARFSSIALERATRAGALIEQRQAAERGALPEAAEHGASILHRHRARL